MPSPRREQRSETKLSHQRTPTGVLMEAADRDKHRDPAASKPNAKSQLEKALSASRFLVVLPVVVLVLAAVGAFVYGADLFVLAVADVASAALPAGHKIGQIMVMIDLFLIGATLLIAAFGFYELFIDRVGDENGSPLPRWLAMKDLNDLKARVIAMIVLIVSVDFVEVLVDSPNGNHILERGAGTALVIGALTAFTRFGSQGGDSH